MTEHANTSRSITAETVEMSPDEKYLFDLLGFLIVRDALSEEHLKLANEAIDSMELNPSPEYFGESVALRGKNSSTRLGNSENLMELPHPHCEPFGRCWPTRRPRPISTPYSGKAGAWTTAPA